MKCISLHQPFATLIANDAKSIETRSWPTAYRGPLAIHAAKRWTEEQRELEHKWPFDIFLAPTFWLDPPLGCIVAVAELFACEQITEVMHRRIERAVDEYVHEWFPHEYVFFDYGEEGDYAVGRWMWCLRDVRAITPIPIREQQGLFDLDPAVVAQIEREVTK